MAKREHKRYQGLYKDPDRAFFSSFVPQTIVHFTIEDTDYPTRPHLVIFWGEFKGEKQPMKKILATDKDLEVIYQTIKDRIEAKNGNK